LDCPKKNWPPGATGDELNHVIAAKLVGNIYPTHMMIILIKTGWDWHFFLILIPKSLAGIFRIGALLPRAVSKGDGGGVKRMGSSQDSHRSIVNPP
jgi:hypothetical protein